MATTLTWTTGPYKAETAGKECVSEVEYRCKGKDASAESEFYGTVSLDRPEDADMIARATFATASTLVTAIKEKLGSSEVTRIETTVKAGVLKVKAPTHQWHQT